MAASAAAPPASSAPAAATYTDAPLTPDQLTGVGLPASGTAGPRGVPGPQQQNSALHQLGALAKSWWDSGGNPVKLGQLLPFPKALGGSGMDNPLLPGNVLTQMEAVRDQAHALWKAGDRATALVKYAESITPILGPLASDIGDKWQRGEWAQGGGELLGAATGMAEGEGVNAGLARAFPLADRPMPTNVPPENTAELNTFAQGHDIPLDAATATNNRFVRGVQKLSDESMLGSFSAERAHADQARALGRTADQLAGQSAPTPIDPADAGSALRQHVKGAVADLNDQVNAAYDRARALEAAAKPETRSPRPGAPFVSMKAPVDLHPVQQATAPILQDLLRQKELGVPLMGDKARAVTVLDGLQRAPRFVPVSTADAAASDLGAIAKNPELAGARTAGQAIAAKAFGDLRTQIDTAAEKVPGLADALTKARKANIAKQQAINLFDEIHEEPVQAFRKATAPGDANIVYLRQLRALAPDVMPQLGRAKLDQIVGKLDLGGDTPLARAKGALADWRQLGPATKRALYGDPQYISDLDRFFRLSARIAENPNPSGTAVTMWKGGEAAQLWISPATGVPYSLGAGVLSKLLHSPFGVKLLTRGLSTPARTVTATRIASQIADLVKADVSASKAGTEQLRPYAAPVAGAAADAHAGMQPSDQSP